MDRIRKALDLARLERAQTGPTPRIDRPVPHEEPAEPHRMSAAPTSILYSRTKVFMPPPGRLERNRIMNPDAAEPAAAAYRMLRTQVLQRLADHHYIIEKGRTVWSGSSAELERETEAVHRYIGL